jgi:RimJ/RimL family protein N-acetyltransferase
MAEVRLRRWRMEDAADVAAAAGDPRVRAWSVMEDDLDVWIQRQVAQDGALIRVICDAEDDRALGRVVVRPPALASAALNFAALSDAERPAGEIGYWILPQARGRGLARAGVAAMLELVREIGELRAIVFDIEVDNVPSERIATALGAERRHPGRPVVDRLGDTHTMAAWVIALAGS